MPVTVRLSRKFYETFGDDVATEFVDWFNSVDATYRSDLRELNELNFARFDAKLEQRMSQLEARLNRSVAELRAEVAALDVRMDARFVAFEGRLVGRLEARVAEVRSELLRWMFAGWTTLMLVMLGTLLAAIRSG